MFSLVRMGLLILTISFFFTRETTCLSLNVHTSKKGLNIYDNTNHHNTISIDQSRRSYLTSSFIGMNLIMINPQPSHANDLDTIRANLLELIQNQKSNEEIINAIDNLIAYNDPSNTISDDLDGEWKLLWSIKAESFSPLLKLPKPLKPSSYQYLGQASASEVGSDRVAQGLTGGILGSNQLWLSSGVRTSLEDNSVLEILPPFRLEYGGRYQSNKNKLKLVESESDADFRKLNARTEEAQAAPKNRYKQLYLERGGGKGSLRISKIVEGDPVIVGAMFVHEKL